MTNRGTSRAVSRWGRGEARRGQDKSRIPGGCLRLERSGLWALRRGLPRERRARTLAERLVAGSCFRGRDPHLPQELPASLPQPGTAFPDAGLVLTCRRCTCLEVLGSSL